MRKRALSLLLCLCVSIQLCSGFRAAASQTGLAEFKASAPDANGCFTITFSIYNTSCNAFQFAFNYNADTVQPVTDTGEAATDFWDFAKESAKADWMSTIGTTLDAENGLVCLAGYVSPGTRSSAVTDGNVVAGSEGVALFEFNFRIIKKGAIAFNLATESSGKAYDKTLPNGGGLLLAGVEQKAAVRFDLSALADADGQTSGTTTPPDVTIGTSDTTIEKPSESENETSTKYLTADELLNRSIILKLNSHAAVVGGGVTAIYPGEKEVCAYLSEEGRTMVPVRFVAEQLGATVDWENSTRTVIIQMNGATIRMPIGSNTYMLNGQTREMDTEAIIVNDRTMVPIRFVAEALGFRVGYDHPHRMAIVSSLEWDMEEETEQAALINAEVLLMMYGMFV